MKDARREWAAEAYLNARVFNSIEEGYAGASI